jgi:hypothetical protein
MLNGELRTALRIKDINSAHILFDFSHHSLQLHALQRYLPTIFKDLKENMWVKSIDFIFRSFDNSSNQLLSDILIDEMCKKRISVMFLRISY